MSQTEKPQRSFFIQGLWYIETPTEVKLRESEHDLITLRDENSFTRTHGSRCYWIFIQIQPSTNASHPPFVSRSAHYLQSHHTLQQTFFSTHARNLNPKAQCHDQSFNTTYIHTMATQITQILETGRQNSLQSIGNDYALDRFRDIFLINCREGGQEKSQDCMMGWVGGRSAYFGIFPTYFGIFSTTFCSISSLF